MPFYENYLMLSQELGDVEGEAKACHFLGYAHYCLGNYKEAVRYYDQDLALARDQQVCYLFISCLFIVYFLFVYYLCTRHFLFARTA